MGQDTGIKLREFQAADIKMLAETFCFPWTSLQHSVEKWTRYHKEHHEGVRYVALLEMQKSVIGYGSLLFFSDYPEFRSQDIPEIHDVWIHEAFRNQGLGRALIGHLEEKALRLKIKKIGLGVGLYKDYGPAQILYAKLGYLPDGNGATYKESAVVPGQHYPVDDDLILWLTKELRS